MQKSRSVDARKLSGTLVDDKAQRASNLGSQVVSALGLASLAVAMALPAWANPTPSPSPFPIRGVTVQMMPFQRYHVPPNTAHVENPPFQRAATTSARIKR